jgi:putative addiction module killer protein
VFEIRYFLTPTGKNVVESWLESLGDDVAEARIDARINRLARGHFGDCKPVGGGVWELRIDWGPGYRVD